MARVLHPDQTSGLPSDLASDREYVDYNALGQRKGYRDRNDTRHGYGYDVLGRPTFDQVTALGWPADGLVLRRETAYDTAGRPYLFTSYDLPDGGSPVGRLVGGVLRRVARTALPIAGRVAGTVFGGPVGGALGGRRASAAGRMFGLELEGLSG